MTPSDSPDPEIGGRCKQRAVIFHGAELYGFEISIGCNAKVMATKVGRGEI